MNPIGFQGALAEIWAMRVEFWQAFGETLTMIGIASVVSITCGGALGIWLFTTNAGQMFHRRSLHVALENVVNFMRSFPFVILMIYLMPLTRLITGTSFGPVAASVSLSVAATFYFARLVDQNLREVPRGVIEAAESLGATPFTIILHVLINEARAGLVLSITILIIAILGESAAAGLIGGGGIGDLGIRYGHQRFKSEIMHTVVLLLSLLVIVIQTTGNRLSKRLNKKA